MTVNLENAKRLARRGWKRGQTKLMWQKERNNSWYNLVPQKKSIVDYDAPNLTELKEMSVKVGLFLDITISADNLAELLIKHLQKNKALNLASHSIQEQGNENRTNI